MSDTAARLLRLLSFLQTPREWSGSELAERLKVSPRTVRRDVDRLRELGYPVQATLGTHGGYRLAAGKAVPPLLVDDEEAVAIVIGLRTAARQPIAGIAEASLRALAKLQQVLPPRLSRRVGALSAATTSAPTTPSPDAPMPTPSTSTSPTLTGSASTGSASTGSASTGSALTGSASTGSASTGSASTASMLSGSMVDPEQLTLLAAAATAHERVRFDYRSDSGKISQRLVEPHSLVVVGRRWYLLAHDNERLDWRIFRVDRIEGAKPTGVRVAPRQPPTGDASKFVTDRLFDKTLVFRAVATLDLPAERAAVRLGDWVGVLEPIDDNTCVWRSPQDTVDWLAFRLALLDCDFTVHEPPELIDHVRRLSKRLNRAVTRPPSKTAARKTAGPTTAGPSAAVPRTRLTE